VRRYHPEAGHAAHYWYVVRRELGGHGCPMASSRRRQKRAAADAGR
jgi:hypothetical protein